jgi:hypothetical protein
MDAHDLDDGLHEVGAAAGDGGHLHTARGTSANSVGKASAYASGDKMLEPPSREMKFMRDG